MEGVTPVLLILAASWLLLVLLLGAVVRELRRVRRQDTSQSLVLLQGQLEALRAQVQTSLEGGTLEVGRRLSETARVVGDVRQRLGEVDRQMRTVGQATEQLRGLQELLRSPKLRGQLGEFLLSDLLGQVLPRAHFSLQYEFSDGARVDAVLRVGERLVPVDAKFPLDNFRRAREDDEQAAARARRAFRLDFRRHVDAIATRYIRPAEGTYEFAMMYVPAEAIFREALEQDEKDGLDLFRYALTRQVVPVSPQSFYAYLQVIVLGLRGLTLEGRTREIVERLGGVRSELDQFTESFELVGRHFGHAHRQLEEAGRRLARLDQALGSLASGDGDPRVGSQAGVAGASEAER